MYNLPSDETKPYENKYQSRKILDELIQKNNYDSLAKEVQYIYKGILFYYLGVNYFDTEETYQAETYFHDSLENFTKLSQE